LPYNGSGVFIRIHNWVQDAAANIKIRADRADAEDDGFATGLSTCITKNGQTTITANLPMATYRHTGVGAAVNRTDYARTAETQDGSLNWVDGGGTADAITASYGIPLTALVDGQLCFVRATAANATTTPTFAPSGLTARTIVKNGGQALVAGDIAGDGHELILRYLLASTRWELLNPAGASALAGNNTFTGTNTFTGKVLTPDDGELTIATGAITVTGVYHTVDTEADAASDSLDTINGGADGQILILQTENSARDVIITNAGNIVTPDGSSFTISTTSQGLALQYSGALSKWFVLSRNNAASATETGYVELATSAEVQTGTDTTRAVTPEALKNGIGFSDYFATTAQTVTTAGTLTIAHGLSATPTELCAYAQCTTAQEGFSIGDRVWPDGLIYTQNSVANYNWQLSADATNITVKFGAGGLLFKNESTGAIAAMTDGNWQLYVIARV